MQLELPMVAKIKTEFRFKIEIDSFVDGALEVWGPKDKDKDGDPEIFWKLDLPGESFDGEGCVEIPVAAVLGSIPDLGIAVMEKTPDFPFKNAVIKALKQALEAAQGRE